MPPYGRDPQQGFWLFVDRRGPDECWPWTGGVRRSQSGIPYPRFWIGKRAVAGHRFALAMKLGRPVQRGKLACHTCDTPLCVNPAHLYEGTTATNAQDREARHRRDTRPGERHHNARLTATEVAAIRAEYAAGGSAHRGQRGSVTYAMLAAKYGVASRYVGRIVRGERWAGNHD